METQQLMELEEKELGALKEFLGALTAERDAIISFSLEGIIRENNRKEEILKKLEFLEAEKEKLLSGSATSEALTETDAWRTVRQKIDGKVKEVRVALEKNMKLLSFSMDHVKCSLEKIIQFINNTSYSKGRSISVMVSRKV